MNEKLKEKTREALSSVLPITAIVLILSFTLVPPSLTVKEAESPENAGFQPLFTHQKCSYILLLFSFLTGFLDA